MMRSWHAPLGSKMPKIEGSSPLSGYARRCASWNSASHKFAALQKVKGEKYLKATHLCCDIVKQIGVC
jgi:hypothetical protein